MTLKEWMRQNFGDISIKSHPTDYSELLWLIFIFVGGAINASVIREFGEWIISTGLVFTLDSLLLFILSLIFIFVLPLIISWLFSKNHPEKRLVPPLLIQAVSFALLLFFEYNQFQTDFGSIYALGIYAFGGGKFQDAIMTTALGKSINPKDILKFSYLIHAEKFRVQEIISTPQFRYLFRLQKKEEKENQSFKLRTNKSRDWQTIIELKEDKKGTILNLAFYIQGSYSVKKFEDADDFHEYAISKNEHLKSYFERRYSIKVESAKLDNTDSLVNFLVENYEGRLINFNNMATQKRVSIILSFILIPASVILCFYGEIGAGISTLVFGITLIINFIIGK